MHFDLNSRQSTIARLIYLTIAPSAIAVSSLIWPLVSSSSFGRETQLTGELVKALKEQSDFNGDGRPGRRQSGGSRSGCSAADSTEKLIALIPSTNLGLTLKERPTFWFYIPYQADEFHSMRLAIWNDEGQKIYQVTQASDRVSPGIVSFSLPTTAEPLKANAAGQYYDWRFSIYCDNPQIDNPKKIYVQGSIQRVATTSTLKRELELATTPIEKVRVYDKHQIWFDAISELGNLRLVDRENRNQEAIAYWSDLLGRVGLSELAAQPLINCCQEPEN